MVVSIVVLSRAHFVLHTHFFKKLKLLQNWKFSATYVDFRYSMEEHPLIV